MLQKKIPDTVVFCSECGARNPTTAKFCTECGLKIDNIKFDNHSFNSETNFSGEKSLELTPAESYVILFIDSANLSTDNAHGKKLLKLTMKDLLARKVIQMDSRKEKGFLSTKIVRKIGKGENFNTDLKPHEEIFTASLTKHPELEIKKYFKKMLKQFKSRLTGHSFFKYKNDYVMPLLIEKGYVILVKKKGIVSPAKYELTKSGVEIKNRINDIFKDSDNLFQWADSNPEKAKAFLSAVGTHIFILPYDMNQLLSLKNRLANVKTKTSKFYPYLLYPVSVLIGIKFGTKNAFRKKEDLDFFDSNDDALNLFDVDVFDALDDLEIDSFDDVFDSFDDICDSFEGGDDDW
ncbi:zinc-ribbon domain-containing protein [Methanobacterium sp.]|uniref:zinc-ribbon domain-containing protein n=1 Tax=Methanobacterium sp. TaxID=2164 RepID=UPI0025FFD139|nr:zinc-ribbon domain-containing protein [Methanobacterium sp.]MBI5459395.1 zinc ribbon domain-containing protein [Methanobacterium sp.]